MEDIKTSIEFDNLMEAIGNADISSEDRIAILSALASYIASR